MRATVKRLAEGKRWERTGGGQGEGGGEGAPAEAGQLRAGGPDSPSSQVLQVPGPGEQAAAAVPVLLQRRSS